MNAVNFHMKSLTIFYDFPNFCAQNGHTPAYLASQRGHTETLALLLSNTADVNAAAHVHQLKIF